MLVSGASTACRALLAQGAAPAAAASLLPAATPALYTAMSKLAAHTSLFSSTTAASKAAAAEPALAEAPSTPSAAKADARPATGTVMMHPGMARDAVLDGPSDTPTPTTAGGKLEGSYLLMHPVYSREYLESVTPQHKPPKKLYEKVGYHAVQGLRSAFDLFTGQATRRGCYGADMNERKWLARFLYLESVAGVPGMVAGMLRHLRSLRTMSRDNGWIHTLLEEAENERMHLLTFMKLRNPGIVFRAAVIAGQAVMFNAYCIAYTLSPRTCHAFVGYLEEEAVKTYTRAIQDLDDGKLPKWSNMQAPDIGKFYWRLDEGATMRDLLLAVRADEHCHKHVNHTFSSLDADDTNPFAPGSVHVP